jgi:hypothetical protein
MKDVINSSKRLGIVLTDIPAYTRISAGYWSLRSMRLKIAALVCFSIFSLNLARTSMSVAMVCMVNSTALAELKQENPEWLFTNNGTNRTGVERTVPDGCSLPDSVRSEYEVSFIAAGSAVTDV